jgi:hypothetical protein
MTTPASHPLPPVTGHALYWLVGALLLAIVIWVFAKAIQILDGVFDNEQDRFRERHQHDAGGDDRQHHHHADKEKGIM